MESTPFKLFVGQVPQHLTAEQLRPTFEAYGVIEDITIILDKTTRASKGCGFVTFSTEEQARAAIEALSDKCVLGQSGKPLVVKFAEGLHQRMENSKLHVSMIPPDMEEEELGELFGRYGEVRQVQLTRDESSQASTGQALVKYAKRSEALAAIAALNGALGLHGSQRPLAVKLAVDKPPTDMPSPPQPPPMAAAYPSSGSPYPGQPPPGAAPPYAQYHPQMAGPAQMQMQAQMMQGQMMQGQMGHGSWAMHAGMQMQGMAPMQMQPMHPSMHPAAAYGMGMGMSGYGGGGGGGPHNPSGHKLFVGMIPYATGDAELQSVFAQFGTLLEVFMMREKDGRSKGCAFVRYYDKRSADAACLALNGTMTLPGAARALVVKYADASEPRSRSSSVSSQASTQMAPPPPIGAPDWQGLSAQGMMAPGSPSGPVPMMAVPSMMAMHPSYAATMGSPMMSPMMSPMGPAPMDGMHGAMPPAAFAMPPSMGPLSSPHGGMMQPQAGFSPRGAEEGSPSQQQQQQAYNQHHANSGAPHALPPGCGYASADPPGGGGGGWASQQLPGMMMPETAPSDGGCGPSCGSVEQQMAAVSLQEAAPASGAGSYDRLYVTNFPKHVTEQDLLQVFGPFGHITELQLLRRADGTSKGTAFVTYTSAAEGYAACTMLATYVLPGAQRPLTIKASTQRRGGGSGGAKNGASSPLGSGAETASPSTSVSSYSGTEAPLHSVPPAPLHISGTLDPAHDPPVVKAGDARAERESGAGVAGDDVRHSEHDDDLLAAVAGGDVPEPERPPPP